MRFGEIFLCRFPFTDGGAFKTRPALVLFDLSEDVLISRVTSVLRSGPLDVQVRDWRVAGLLEPSVVRLDRVVTAEKTIFLRLLGTLSDEDAATVRKIWNTQMRL